LNPDSLITVKAKVEPSLRDATSGQHLQFERVGFFIVDPDSTREAAVFNRTVALKDSWAKTVQAPAPKKEKPAATPKAASSSPKKPEKSADDVLAAFPALRALLDAAVAKGADAKAATSLLTNDVLGEMRGRELSQPPFGGDALAELLTLIGDGTLSTKLAKDVLAAMFDGEGSPRAIVEKRGMKQIADPALVESAVAKVMAANADAVARYRAGNANVLGALVGLTIKETGGKANPKLVTDILRSKLA